MNLHSHQYVGIYVHGTSVLRNSSKAQGQEGIIIKPEKGNERRKKKQKETVLRISSIRIFGIYIHPFLIVYGR